MRDKESPPPHETELPIVVLHGTACTPPYRLSAEYPFPSPRPVRKAVQCSSAQTGVRGESRPAGKQAGRQAGRQTGEAGSDSLSAYRPSIKRWSGTWQYGDPGQERKVAVAAVAFAQARPVASARRGIDRAAKLGGRSIADGCYKWPWGRLTG